MTPGLLLRRKAIGCKWLFTTKYKADGSLERHKAGLVALGNRQTYGIDNQETFAHVAKMTTVRTPSVVATMRTYKMWQIDVTNAFFPQKFV